MRCTACCCIPARPAAFIIAIFSFVGGIAMLVGLGTLIQIDESEKASAAMQDEEDSLLLGNSFKENIEIHKDFAYIEEGLRGIVYAMLVPTILSVIIGIVLFGAALKRCSNLSRLALGADLLSIFGTIVTGIVMMICGIHWYFPLLLLPYILLHCYFAWGIVNYWHETLDNAHNHDSEMDNKNVAPLKKL